MYRFYSIIIPFLCYTVCFSQSIKNFHIPDSLKNKNYEQLQKAYDKVFRIDNNKAELYANTILSKGKKEKNNDLIYDGYYKIAYAKGVRSQNGHPYIDTLIDLTSKIVDYEYPAKAYILKGLFFYNDANYKDALEQYIIAQKLSKNKNLDQFYFIKKLIGALKSAIDENDEAIPLFLDYYNYEKRLLNTPKKDIRSYIGAIFSLANAYNKNKNYKECKFYNKVGINECKKYNDFAYYDYFIMSEGIADYFLKNYNISVKRLLQTEKGLLKMEDFANLSILYYYLGKINFENKREDRAIHFFIKSDSISFLYKNFEPVTREKYEILIDYFKKRGDKENQLKYIDKLFYADSIVNNSKKYISKEIYKKYDTPILLEKKEELISDLNYKNSLLYWFLAVGFLIISILIYIYIKNKKRIREYQDQAELLLRKSKESSRALALPNNEEVIESTSKEIKVKNPIPNNKLQDIRIKLEQFENKKDFLRKNITVESLAKDLETNRDYLSKSVNELKGKNFSQYLNELRITYIVDELNNNEKLRKYTILAIADDIGYNNSESFSNAFKKITGTLPSYYIKLLQNQNQNQNQNKNKNR